MSLDYGLGKIENYNEYCFSYIDGKKKMEVRTEMMIFLCMIVGIHEISDRTVDDFYLRVFMWEKIHGSMCSVHDAETFDWKDKPMKFDDVVNHIGLHTNASMLTWAQFAKKLKNSAIDTVKAEKRNRVRDKEKLNATANTDSDSDTDRPGV